MEGICAIESWCFGRVVDDDDDGMESDDEIGEELSSVT